VYRGRVVTLVLGFWADQAGDDFAAISRNIDAAMQILQDDVLPLYVDDSTKLLWVRPVAADIPQDWTVRGRVCQATLQFRAGDPFIYDAVETAAPIPIAGGPGRGNWTFPWVFPWTFQPAGTPPQVNSLIFNSGTIDIAPRFRIAGPVDQGFVLLNVTTSAALRVMMSLGPTDWLDVDMATERVLFQGVAERNDTIVPGTDFWTMPPGENTVRMELIGANTTATAEIFYRSAYTAV